MAECLILERPILKWDEKTDQYLIKTDQKASNFKLLGKTKWRIDESAKAYRYHGVWLPKSQTFIISKYEGCGDTFHYIFIKTWLYPEKTREMGVNSLKRDLEDILKRRQVLEKRDAYSTKFDKNTIEDLELSLDCYFYQKKQCF
jgi:hypothetical protein